MAQPKRVFKYPPDYFLNQPGARKPENVEDGELDNRRHVAQLALLTEIEAAIRGNVGMLWAKTAVLDGKWITFGQHDPRKAASQTYKFIARQVHPDKSPNDEALKSRATVVSQHLGDYFPRWTKNGLLNISRR